MADTIKLQVRFVPDTTELEKVLKEYQGQKIQVDSILPPGLSGGSGSAGKTGISNMLNIKGLISAFAPVAAIITGIKEITSIISSIQENTKQMMNSMEDINPALAGQTEMLNKINSMALLPMSQLMTMLMKPYLQLMLVRIRKQLTEAAPVLKSLAAGEITYSEAESKLMPIFNKTQEILAFYNSMLVSETKPIASSMAGFTSAITTLRNQWTAGLDEWVKSFFEGIKKAYAGIPRPKEVRADLDDAFDKEKEVRLELPPKLDNLNTLTIQDMKEVNTNFKTELYTSFLNPFGNTADTFIRDWQDELQGMIDDAAEARKKLEYPEGEERGKKSFWDNLKDSFKNILKGILGPWSNILGLDDFILSNGKVYSINPNDTITGYKDKPISTSSKNINISLHVDGFLDDTTINEISRRIRLEVDRGI